jgi:hypothetical protein
MTLPVDALVHIILPFSQQKQYFAGIALLVMYVLHRLSRHLLSAIVIAIIAYTSWHGLSWPRFGWLS